MNLYDKHVKEMCEKLEIPYERNDEFFIDPRGKKQMTKGVVNYEFGKFIDVFAGQKVDNYLDEPIVDVRAQWEKLPHKYGCGLAGDLTFNECMDKITSASFVKQAFLDAVKMAQVRRFRQQDLVEAQLARMEKAFQNMLKDVQRLRLEVARLNPEV